MLITMPLQRLCNAAEALYSKTSQDGHPSGNAKVAVLQRWPSYGNLQLSAIESENISRGVSRVINHKNNMYLSIISFLKLLFSPQF